MREHEHPGEEGRHRPPVDRTGGAPREESWDESGLLAEEDRGRLRARWESIQASFIDEPRAAVEDANRLVSEVADQVVRRFEEHRHDLEGRWSRREEVSTEDLRQNLQRYRAFFDRLLSL